MLQYNPTVSGSLSVTGTITATQGITGSFSGSVAGFPTDVSAFSASLSTRITATESTSSEYVTTSGSLASRVSLTEATASQYVTASGSLAARLTSNEAKTGSFATTGSNYFIGTQVVTGSVYITSDLVVQGSSSLQNITASAVSVGTNTIILNTATPILQFGGISVQDSGSTMGRSGSLLWNSINDHWINVNPSGSDEGYNSAMVINGPKNTGSLGNEAGLTTNYIPVSQGEDHITDSIIFQSGSARIGIGTTSPQGKLDITGTTSGDLLYLDAGVNTDFAYKVVSGADDAFVLRRQHTTQSGLDIMSWTYSGKVGIGTTTPSEILDIRGANRDISSAEFNQVIYTTTSQSAGFGGAIGLGGYYTGTTVTAFGGIKGAKENSTDSNTAGYLSLYTRPNAGAITERMRLTSGGNVLIGNGASATASNLLSLDITTADQGIILITRSNGATNSRWGIVNQGVNNTAYIGTFVNNAFTLYANSAERVRIETNGNVGIGITTPYSRLDINGGNIRMGEILNSASSYIGKQYSTNSNFYSSIQFYSTSGEDAIVFNTHLSGVSSGERMRITGGGNVGIGTTNPGNLLTVNGTISSGTIVSTSDSTEQIVIRRSSNTDQQLTFGRTSTYAQIFGITQNVGYVSLVLNPSGGNVGIGLTNPSSTLQVNGNTTIAGDFTQNGSMTSYVGYFSTSDGYPSCDENARIYNIGTINSNGSGGSSIIIEVIGSHRGYNNSSYVEYKRYVCFVGDRISSVRIDAGGSDSRVGIYNGTNGEGLNGQTAAGWNLQLIVNPRCGAAMNYTCKVTHTNLDMTKGNFNYSYFGSYSTTVT